MEHPVPSFCTTSWSFLLGSSRTLIFPCCVLLATIQIMGLIASTQVKIDNLIQPDAFKTSAHDITMMLLLSLLGCYGSFYKHRQALQLFSFLMILYSLYSILEISFAPGDFERANKDIEERMTGYFKYYEWESKVVNNDATKAWNSLQSLGCCGLRGFTDWDQFRPINASGMIYPASCCAYNTMSCTRGSALYVLGCKERLREIEGFGILMCSVFIGFRVLLGILAGIVGTFSIEQIIDATGNSPNMIGSGFVNFGKKFSNSFQSNQ